MSKVRGIIVALVVCGGSSPALAQMPSSKFEPLNHIGRALGIGWSDGYNECEPSYLDRLSNLKPSGGNALMQSQLYEAATFPPAQNLHLGLRHSHAKQPCNCPVCASLSEQPSYASPIYAQPSIIGADQPMTNMQPVAPIQPMPHTPAQDALSPIPNTFVPLESVPNQMKLTPSPSDAGPSLVPIAPKYEPEPIPAQPNDSLIPQDPPGLQISPPTPSQSDDDSLLIPDEAMLRRYRAQRAANRYTPVPANRYTR